MGQSLQLVIIGTAESKPTEKLCSRKNSPKLCRDCVFRSIFIGANSVLGSDLRDVYKNEVGGTGLIQ